ncbi:MAG: hypothetical protein H7Y59_04365 [Anaerolineales bacterium]|nr:hypothetical protein [Anaerolineales bacterium]
MDIKNPDSKFITDFIVKNYTSKSVNDFINETFSESIKKIEKDINLNYWGFKMIDLRLYPKFMPRAIFQSTKCIVDFRWNQERPYTEPFISTTYARLHAPLDSNLMKWNGQQCHCWHSAFHLLRFLDDLPPPQTSLSDYDAPLIFQDSKKFLNKGENYFGEYVAKQTLLIWNHYGDRLFNLLDLQRPELWEKYSLFLKEFYDHQDEIARRNGNDNNFDLRLYMVC